ARFGTQQMRSSELPVQSADIGSAKDAFPRVQGDISNPVPDARVPPAPKIFYLRQLRHGAEHRRIGSKLKRRPHPPLGSARVSRVGDGVSPSRTSPTPPSGLQYYFQERLFHRDGETSTRDARYPAACAPQSLPPRPTC